MSEIANLVSASIGWFTPLAAVRVFENAFGLSYTGVNMSCLTMTLLFVPCLSYIYMIIPNPKTIGLIANAASLVGFTALLSSQYFLSSLDPGAQFLFWVAISLSGFYFADNLVKALVTAAAKTSIQVESGNGSGSNRTSSMELLGLPVGMLGALIITELMYDVKNTYFIHEMEALNECSVLSIFLLSISMVTGLGGILCG